jgi:tRNA(fMet)-specific endonuclease VapC
MIYLLDTNACVEFLRGRNAMLVQRVRARPPDELCLCSVVKAELYYGVLRSTQVAQNRAKVDSFVQSFASLPFDDPAADVQATIRAHLESQGTSIGPYDLQIAAIALVHNLTLVTLNTSEFGRVPGLTIDDWEVP